jgi:two-component system chemotaxis response regulator CheY
VTPKVIKDTVLVVDDEMDIRETIQEALELYDIPVAIASNGQDALDVLSKRSDIGLILLDLMMPTMDGKEFMERQGASPEIKEIPVVIVSANREVELNSLHLRAQGFLKKPIDLGELIDAVKINQRPP